MGMLEFNQSQMVNSINLITEGADKGKLRISISRNVFVDNVIVVSPHDVEAVMNAASGVESEN